MIKFFVILTSLAASFGVHAGVVGKLSEFKHQISAPQLTADERQLIADQALLLLGEMFVHRELKREAFGVDPVPQLLRLQSQAKALSDAEMYATLRRVFLAERDRHTNFYMPKPGGCYSSFLPVDFEYIDDGTVALTFIDRDLVEAAPDLAKLRYGDRILRFNGVEIFQALRDRIPFTEAANPAAERRLSLSNLVWRGHRRLEVPEQDEVTLDVRTGDGRYLVVRLPWMLWSNEWCLNNSTSVTGPNRGVDEDQLERAKVFSRPRVQTLSQPVPGDLSGLIQTAWPSLSYKRLINSHGEFAYLRMTNFEESGGLETDGINDLVGRLLQNELSGTKGVIIDLRGNPGGWISVGEVMVKQFSRRRIVPMDFQLLTTPANIEFLSLSQWHRDFRFLALGALADGHAMSYPGSMTDPAWVNSLPQSYSGPVVVMVDGGCYSTCDMFSSGIQDHGLGEIWSRDASTGGGGANVVSHSYLLEESRGLSTRLRPMPLGIDMRIAWRRSVRVGLHAGEILENTGVVADRVIPATYQDLVGNDIDLVNALTRHLADQLSRHMLD